MTISVEMLGQVVQLFLRAPDQKRQGREGLVMAQAFGVALALAALLRVGFDPQLCRGDGEGHVGAA